MSLIAPCLPRGLRDLEMDWSITDIIPSDAKCFPPTLRHISLDGIDSDFGISNVVPYLPSRSIKELISFTLDMSILSHVEITQLGVLSSLRYLNVSVRTSLAGKQQNILHTVCF
jgi:hypothetical protein